MSDERIKFSFTYDVLRAFHLSLGWEVSQIPFDKSNFSQMMRASLLSEMMFKAFVKLAIPKDKYIFSITHAQAYAILCSSFAATSGYEREIMRGIVTLLGQKVK